MSTEKKLLHFVYVALCVAGMAWQVIQLGSDYFSYSTDTRIKIKYPTEFYFPTVTVCIRYNDIIDYDKANSQGHTWTTSLNYSEVQRVQREITIREIFDLTPNGSNIVETFCHRNETGYEYIRSDDEQSVRSVLNVEKFIYIEYICYRIEMKQPMRIKTNVVSVHPIASGTLGEMTMGRLFRNVTRYKVSLHDRQSLPYESLMVQPIIRRSGRDLKSLNTVFAFPGNFTITYLKAPYSTNCFDYGEIHYFDRAHCIQSCVLKNTFKQFNKYPYSAFVENSTDHQLVNYQDAGDVERSQHLDRIASECEKSMECRRKTCLSTTTITYLNIVDGTDEDFAVIVAVPQHPWTYISHYPSINLVTYIIYTMGAFGTWTGLSVISLNPFAILLRRKEKEREMQHIAQKVRLMSSFSSQSVHDSLFSPPKQTLFTQKNTWPATK